MRFLRSRASGGGIKDDQVSSEQQQHNDYDSNGCIVVMNDNDKDFNATILMISEDPELGILIKLSTSPEKCITDNIYF